MELIQSEVRVGIADYKIAHAPSKLITVGLGSCIGTIIYDEHTQIGGLSHIMLPDSRPFAKKQALNTAKFADLALPEMVDKLKQDSPRARFKAKIVGGANMFGFKTTSKTGNIGQRNIAAVEEMLQKLGIPLIASHVGGNSGRTMIVDLKTFETMVRIVHHDAVYI
ncbi:chemotaxis protein CheD [Liquorilactobacillus sucicola DSM 21376 = JCM 15457]|uniref:Probable chemoreceptor glutamine deamidase CheD n=2 Tax=Liquorilactobacillus sucicola TaxID=519050 RepID=A0A023CXT5_9LACO|nr:chemotaxis protein CheD [Liquorilactobacillus sucicola]AJA34360.1 chemotaxis protein CheD [Liquorilactobacillus sucicola]KRN06858.1 chemoreceptor glutamine deamidase CheD [Liquorilactobacillus sucicola DSM 21376 = JCM 15457]GAJ26335.1 chemotaxis protein CheD [Liquorilactobacillus sucicola DSM 21376 = JCM 15457]